MRRTGWLLLATALLVLSAQAADSEEVRGDEVRPEETIRRAEARIERDDLAGALEILDAGLEALPAEERAVSWEHDLDGLYVNAVLIGSRHVYVLAHVHRWSRHPFVTVAGGPRLEDWEMGYDFDGSATCLDARSGRPLWHRRTTGQWEAELDPESDDLLFWRRDLVRLDADTGAETGRSRIGEDWQRLDGLLVGAHP